MATAPPDGTPGMRQRRGFEVMEFGENVSSPLLQTAMTVGEATIRQACGSSGSLSIHVELDQTPEGRDAVRVTLRSNEAFSGFRMILRTYFDRSALWRVARHAWQRRVPCGHPNVALLPIRAACASMN